MSFSGAVLAGGQSSRFGQDKARYGYRGKPLMQWVLEGLSPAAERYIVASRDYSEFGVRVWPDQLMHGDSLSGLHAALKYAKEDWVAVAGCDQPFLTAEYWAYMHSLTSKQHRVIAAWHVQGFFEPLGAIYHKSLEPLVLARLEAGQFKMQELLHHVGALQISAEDLTQRFGPNLFVNANRLEDLQIR